MLPLSHFQFLVIISDHRYYSNKEQNGKTLLAFNTIIILLFCVMKQTDIERESRILKVLSRTFDDDSTFCFNF